MSPLPPDIAQNFKRAVQLAASEALRAASSSAQTIDQKEVAAGLRACLEQALADLPSSGVLNTETTPLGRMFNELWCLVFSYLSMADLVTASHVCSKWRAFALGHPRLWCNIDFVTYMHANQCDCRRDEGRPRSSNFKLVQAALSRSGSVLPISLHVHVGVACYSYTELDQLSRALVPYEPRLVELDIWTAQDQAHYAILADIDCLPALHTLSIKCSPSCGPLGGAHFLFQPSLGLPVLKNLTLDVTRDTLDPPKLLPALSSLNLRFGKSEDIDLYLRIAPCLRHLHLRPSTTLNVEPEEAYRRVREHTRNIDTIEVRNIFPAIEPGILAMFDSETFCHMFLQYKALRSQGPALDGTRILRHLGAIDELRIELRHGPRRGHEQLRISATSPTGQSRALAFAWQPDNPACKLRLSALWGHLAAPPRSLVVDARLWSTLEQLPLHMASGVKDVSLLGSWTLSALVQETPHLAGAFTALESVARCASDASRDSAANAQPIPSDASRYFTQWLCYGAPPCTQ